MTATTKRIGATFGLALLMTSTSVLAQTAPAAAPEPAQVPEADAAPAGDSGLADIVVTAQRRSERLQDVPLSVSAFTDQELSVRQVARTLDLIAYVPNLIGHNNTALGTANAYTLRGLGNTESIATFDVPVGSYVDDVFLSRQGANNFSFFDVERVEVLRGPQGTLFGRNTTGGAINVIMKKPGNDFTGFAEAGYGRYNRTQGRASVDIPIVEDKLLTKVSGYFTRADGYVYNQTTGERLNGDHSWGLRGAVRGLISDNVTWDLSSDYVYANGANLVNFYRDSDNKRINFTKLRSDTAIGSIVSPELADNMLGNTAKSYSIISNLKVDVGAATVNFITGYRHLFQEYVTDSADSRTAASVIYKNFDYISSSPGTTTVLANDAYSSQFTQEIKVTGKAFNGFLDYVGGFYYLNEKNRTSFANVNVPLVGSATVTQDRTVRNGTEAYAGYAQFDAHPVQGLTLTAGIRYTDEFKDVAFAPNPNSLPRSGVNNQPFSTIDVVKAGIPITQSSKVWTPRFAINYKITPDVMVFASATKGFKSGGWNARANYAALAVPFTRETIWSYEAGIRSEFFDHHLRVNLTGFSFVDRDFQLPAGYLDPITSTITYLTRNFADLKNYGLEGEVTVIPVTGLNIYWSFGMQKARYENLNPAVYAQIARCKAGIVANNCNAGIVTPTGTVAEPVRVPRFASTLGANYTFHLGDATTLVPNATWQYTDGSWVSTSDDPRGYQDKHSLFNFGLTLRNSNLGASITAECTNCFDKTFKTSFLIYPYLNDPGRWMLRVRKDF
ncbi:MAG: TonB-dependent receptor [Pseudomonadota bacterium]|uniref:TonB-dependent receptor n=1 Tax=Sphingomonas sp. ERG5 TaxID=1381597 RepID=UPI000689817B|nr:TonB-dependent receptor [Sphingomonas sp. ERG5]